MKNNSGFTLIELILVILIIGVVAICIISGINKSIKIKVKSEKVPTNIISKPSESIIMCVDGFKTIFIDGENYNIGKKDNWGDIKAIPCE